MKKSLLAMWDLLPEQMNELEQHFNVIRLHTDPDPETTLKEHQNDIVAILAWYMFPVSKRLISALPNLEIISIYGVGINFVDIEAAHERGVIVTYTPDVLSPETADTAMALLLAVARKICEADMYVRVGKWLNGPMSFGTSVNEKTVGILGLGRIGKAIAKRCEAFEMNVIYHGRHEQEHENYTYYDNLEAMASDCDFLVVACPGGEQTENLVDYKILSALGSNGYVINIARGTVINEDDLVSALEEGTIAGAGLDVFRDEPHVPDELIKMDNVVLLPHIGSATYETRAKMGRLVIDNLFAHFNGNPLLTPVAA
jgi:hydroxypyruvate reductase 2